MRRLRGVLAEIDAITAEDPEFYRNLNSDFLYDQNGLPA